MGPRSLFQDTVLRLAVIKGARAPLVVAGTSHQASIERQLSEVGIEGVLLLEPEGRESGPAIAAAAEWISRCDPKGVAVIVASDHHIPDAAAFARAALTATEAARSGAIVTFGVQPTAPLSAYGYIKPGAPGEGVRKLQAFIEKPDVATAQGYVESGYLWNSGNFVARADVLVGEFARYEPRVHAAVRQALDQAGDARPVRLGPAFRGSPKISVDYAVMERTALAAVLPVDFAWSDVGAWDAVHAASDQDVNGNSASGEVLLEGARDCLVRAAPGMSVALVGVSGLMVVAEGDAVLVAAGSESQRVKTIVERLKVAGSPRVDLPGPSATPLKLEVWAERYWTWLRTAALPLWWTLGADHDRGGFQELLDVHGVAMAVDRRVRIQTRQVIVYAQAGMVGWSGPWRAAVQHGLSGLFERYRRPDGLYRNLVGSDSEVRDNGVRLYEQAFMQLALAAAAAADPARSDLRAEGAGHLRALQAGFRHSAGGYREADDHPFQSNAQMHLLESALAWVEAGEEGPWAGLADELAELCLRRFIDPATGALPEFFDDGWRAEAGPGVVMPGHQFEWAWLLVRWSKLRGRHEGLEPARRLFEAGRQGVDLGRSVAVDGLDGAGAPVSRRARLWPQTERLKASITLAEQFGEKAYLVDAADAAAGLWRYLDMPVVGLWRDKMQPDGTMVDEAAPASSLYHITGAVLALKAWADATRKELNPSTPCRSKPTAL
jgi:mannose/cellobiose epimerase-like protein (N-acyl-D-glucosamine 2-epimerase family)/mannose-1-phosphate guanylyltransferase